MSVEANVKAREAADAVWELVLSEGLAVDADGFEAYWKRMATLVATIPNGFWPMWDRFQKLSDACRKRHCAKDKTESDDE